MEITSRYAAEGSVMINRVAITKPQPFPIILKYADIRSYVFTLVFILLDVAVPWLFHQFNLAGPTFLPMHIFVLIAGLIFGWRAGLIVGLLTPLASVVSHRKVYKDQACQRLYTYHGDTTLAMSCRECQLYRFYRKHWLSSQLMAW